MHAWFDVKGRNAVRFRFLVAGVLRMLWVVALIQGVLGERVPFLSRHPAWLTLIAVLGAFPVLLGVGLALVIARAFEWVLVIMRRVHAAEMRVAFVVRGQHIMLAAFFMVLFVLAG